MKNGQSGIARWAMEGSLWARRVLRGLEGAGAIGNGAVEGDGEGRSHYGKT